MKLNGSCEILCMTFWIPPSPQTFRKRLYSVKSKKFKRYYILAKLALESTNEAGFKGLADF